jgi:type VI protein secretion system component VasF
MPAARERQRLPNRARREVEAMDWPDLLRDPCGDLLRRLRFWRALALWSSAALLAVALAVLFG